MLAGLCTTPPPASSAPALSPDGSWAMKAHGDDLARLACEGLRPEDGRVLHVAGSDVAGDLAGALRRAGFTVERAVLYEARPASSLGAPTAHALASGLIDFALFYSPRTAAIF